jgi:hypothetical protein
MKLKLLFLSAVLLLAAASGCSKQPEIITGQNMAAGGFAGTVLETMDAGGYTYVLVDNGKDKQWAAAPGFEIKAGDRVIVPQGSPMRNFHSKTLNRTFDDIFFVARVSKEGEKSKAGGLPEGHVPISTGNSAVSKSAGMDFSGIQKPEGGKTIAEIYVSKEALVEQEVLVRGKVVKFVSNVMGRNWFHLQDGTGEKGSNDLTITANVKVTAGVGDTVTVRGKVMLNRDFGSGYRYDLLIIDGKITVEP